MLGPQIRLGTSTPKADPFGVYAFESFGKAEGVKPGARAALEHKSLKLVGTEDSAAPPSGRIVYGWHVDEGRADIFLTYRTNALAAQQQYPGQQVVELPEELAVGADYGLTVMNGAPAEAGTAGRLNTFGPWTENSGRLRLCPRDVVHDRVHRSRTS